MGAPGATDLQRRVLLTLALLGGYVAARQIPSFGVDTEAIPEIADKTAMLSLGIRPALSAYMFVEFFAWAVPRWRNLRESSPGRDVLERTSAIVTVIYSIFQAFAVAKLLDSLSEELAMTSQFLVVDHSPVLVMLSMAAGAGVALLFARLLSRLGLLNGFVALLLVELAMDSVSRGTAPGIAWSSVTDTPLIVATALVLPVVATILVVATEGPQKAGEDIDIPSPASSLQPVAIAGAVIAVPTAIFGDASSWGFLDGIPASALWLKGLTTAIAGLVLCAVFTSPGPLAFVLANTGVPRAPAMRLARAAASRAFLPAALFVLVLAVCDYTSYRWIGSQLLSVNLALATALVIDARGALATRLEGGWVRIFRDPRPQLVAVAARQLRAKGVEPRIGTRAQSALLRAFGAYASSEIYVREPDAARASELVKRVFSGPADETLAPREEAMYADVEARLDADIAPAVDAAPAEPGPSTEAGANAFAPPKAEDHEKRPLLSTLELRLAILVLAAVVAPTLAD